MIFSLSGTVEHIGPNYVAITTGGVGYQVFVTSSALSELHLKQPAALWTSHLITDSSQALYGFGTLEERDFFEQLLTVSGVGGKTAINIMGLAPLADLQAAIRSGEPTMLTRVSGVGKKTAQRIIVELKEKIGSGEALSATQGDAFEALLGLGYNAHDIRESLRSISAAETEQIIKEALKKLGSQK
ncbi:Holliday junction branch migration protein RuvA [Candidatus Uhrbacteria bacterium]|nr:Holliday junction branch migration protein RuvA [Candidatus Uhrbacteria bacterium]